MADTIICSKCGQERPRHRQGSRRCKECRLAYMADWKLNNHGRFLAKNAEWVRNNKAKADGYKRKWAEANRENIRQAFVDKYWADPERARERNRKQYHADIEASRAYGLRKYYANIERNREAGRRRSRENNGARRDYTRAWRHANPEKVASQKSRRRARVQDIGEIPRGWKSEQRARQGGKCAGCQQRFTQRRKATIDHVVPLAACGTNGIGNLQLLCSRCNSSKNAKPDSAWRRERGQLL